jgi:hypothetical protein
MDVETLVSGFLGGAMLAAVRMIRTFPVVMSAQDMKVAQFISAHCLLALLLGLMGAAVVWALEGRASAFIEGIGALSFLTLLAADSPSSPEPGEEQR